LGSFVPRFVDGNALVIVLGVGIFVFPLFISIVFYNLYLGDSAKICNLFAATKTQFDLFFAPFFIPIIFVDPWTERGPEDVHVIGLHQFVVLFLAGCRA
jgi:hypothetical protein